MQLNKHESIHIYHGITHFGFASFFEAVCFFAFGAIEFEQSNVGVTAGGGEKTGGSGVLKCTWTSTSSPIDQFC